MNENWTRDYGKGPAAEHERAATAEIGTAVSPGLPKPGGQAKGMVIRVVESAPRTRSGNLSPQYQSPKDVPLPISPPAAAYVSPHSPRTDFPNMNAPPPPPPHRTYPPQVPAHSDALPSPSELPATRSPPPLSPDHPTSPSREVPSQYGKRASISRKPVAPSSTMPTIAPAPRPTFPSSTYRQPSGSSLVMSPTDQIPRPRQVSGETISTVDSGTSAEQDGPSNPERPAELRSELQYHHRNLSEGRAGSIDKGKGLAVPSSGDGDLVSGPRDPSTLSTRQHQLRPYSSYSSLDGQAHERMRSTAGGGGLSPLSYGRGSQGRRSPDHRMSYVDLLNVPYPQPAPPALNVDNARLRAAVGASASLLSSRQTLDAYRANVKKASDPSIQYSFAIFLLETAQQEAALPTPLPADASTPQSLIQEARTILQRLADRSYPFAQYYLADGYSSGAFLKAGRPDADRAFPLFVAAAKHGHAEAGYRAALCYEFGWGTRRDPAKAVQFFRQSAARNHLGAMARLGRACLAGDLGMHGGGGGGDGGDGSGNGGGSGATDGKQYREGLKWLKRAAESADPQYNGAPYELGVLHERGYGADVFRDETYAAQLFTQSADLGHPEANYRLGDAYEHGKLGCPKDPALSVHFYNGAASRGHPLAMMALCAWYMVGAAPVLERDENEAYEWAKRAAELELPKAEYAVGYFTEMGIGCRRDPLEANVWYVRAADQGDERAKHRIAAIRAAASGGGGMPMPAGGAASEAGNGVGKAGGGVGRNRLKGKAPMDTLADAPAQEGKGKKIWGLF